MLGVFLPIFLFAYKRLSRLLCKRSFDVYKNVKIRKF